MRVVTGAGERRARRVVVTLPVGALAGIDFTPGLSEAKRAAVAQNHAGQGAKVWVLARGVPDDLCAMGYRTRLDFLGAMETTAEGVVLVGFGPSAAALDVGDPEAVTGAVHELAPEAEVVAVHAHDWVGDPYSRGTWAVLRPGPGPRGVVGAARARARRALRRRAHRAALAVVHGRRGRERPPRRRGGRRGAGLTRPAAVSGS